MLHYWNAVPIYSPNRFLCCMPHRTDCSLRLGGVPPLPANERFCCCSPRIARSTLCLFACLSQVQRRQGQRVCISTFDAGGRAGPEPRRRRHRHPARRRLQPADRPPGAAGRAASSHMNSFSQRLTGVLEPNREARKRDAAPQLCWDSQKVPGEPPPGSPLIGVCSSASRDLCSPSRRKLHRKHRGGCRRFLQNPCTFPGNTAGLGLCSSFVMHQELVDGDVVQFNAHDRLWHCQHASLACLRPFLSLTP
jgi:hypothetical protein